MKGNVKNKVSPATHHETGKVHPQGIRGRTGSRKGNRLDARQAAHAELPCAADGSQYTNQKPKSIQPGSLNPAKH